MPANTWIESLGVYLPPRELSTAEVIAGCRHRVRFPLERLTGIQSRHVAGDTEFSIDLARHAIVRCFAGSRYQERDVDVLISTSIARYDAAGFRVTFEPSTALRLKQYFGCERAVAYDIGSACAGMFAAIYIVDALLKIDAIGCALVVSGEYISHLAATAQKEIDGMLDPRLACLTLGDSGAAVMLAPAPHAGVGFDAIELRTYGAFARYCVGRPTEQEHGGAIMHTDALKLTDVATRYGAEHALHTLQRAGWSMDSFHHLILHQTSRTGLASAMREINRRLKRPVCHDANTIDNLTRRGNTATTTHFVALADHMRSGRIRAGDRVIFAVSGSGLTVGTALYTFDDLPERFGRSAPPAQPAVCRVAPRSAARVRIAGVATAPRVAGRAKSLDLLRRAATDCLQQCACGVGDVGLLMYVGTYRSEFITEPAVATLLAGELEMNTANAAAGAGTLAFDVFNGAVALLNACDIAARMIIARKVDRALVVAAEVENNADDFPDDLLGIEETGSALLLEAAPDDSGFGAFHYRTFTEHARAFTSSLTNRAGRAYLEFYREPELDRLYIECIVATVGDLLHREDVGMDRIRCIMAPQIAPAFVRELARAMGIEHARFVDVTNGRDLFTSSVPYAFREVVQQRRVRRGDLGLIICAGSGIQVGCTLYTF